MSSPPQASRRTRLALAAGALLLLVVGVRAALPRVAAMAIERQAAAALGRAVRVDDVDLALFAGRFVLEGFEAGGPIGAGASPARPPIRVDRISLDLGWRALLAGEIRVSEIAVAAPQLAFERDAEGALVPLVLAESGASPADAAPDPGAEPDADAAPDPGAESDADAAPDPGAEPDADTDGAAGTGPAWPLRLDRVVVRDVSVHVPTAGAGPEGERNDLAFTLATLRLEALAFVDGVLAVGGLSFEDPGLRLRREFAAGGAPGAPPTPEAGADAASGPGPLAGGHRLDSVAVHDARFTLLWEGAEPLEVSLDLSAEGVRAARDAPFPVRFSLQTEASSLSLDGEATLLPAGFEGELGWQGLRLARLLDASGVEAGLRITSGRTDGSLRVEVTTAARDGDPAAVALSGDLSVNELDAAREGLEMAWSALEVGVASIRIPLAGSAAPSVELSRVRLASPLLVVRVPGAGRPAAGSGAEPGGEDGGAPAAGPEGAPAAGEAGEPAPAAEVEIDVLEVRDGDVRFVDRSLAREVSTHWQQVTLDATGLRWPEGDAEQLVIGARTPDGARLSIDASLDGVAGGGSGRVETSLSRLRLRPFDPYADAFTGLRIESGEASLDGTLERSGATIRTRSRVLLHRLGLDEREPGWFQRVFGMPLDVALALLRDSRGDIELPIRATVSPDETRVGLASLLASALRQALVGALASPLKLLGGAAKLAGEVVSSGLAPLPGVPGSPQLAAEARERLPELATVLASRPMLQLEMQGRAGPEDDPGIARRHLIVQARMGEALSGGEALGFFERRSLRDALAQLTPDFDPADPDRAGALDEEDARALARLVERYPVSTGEREALARARAQRAREVLLREHGVAPDAVALADPLAGEPGIVLGLDARETDAGSAEAEPAETKLEAIVFDKAERAGLREQLRQRHEQLVELRGRLAERARAEKDEEARARRGAARAHRSPARAPGARPRGGGGRGEDLRASERDRRGRRRGRA